MRLYQALKISHYVRRSTWVNPKYYITFIPHAVCSTGVNDILTNEVLGLKGLLAEDWVALLPLSAKELYKVDDKEFEVISTPLDDEDDEDDEDFEEDE